MARAKAKSATATATATETKTATETTAGLTNAATALSAATDGKSAIRPLAEITFSAELAALSAGDDRPRPPRWQLSPWAVRTYLLGGTLADGTVIQPKYIGDARRIEVAVATLATDRALLLYGLPGTAKSWVGEHLAAAISGDSSLIVQGTAGTDETAIRYGWNYAQLLADGPSIRALVPSPVLRGMADGKLVRIEELTRMTADVQDALITILSEKLLPIPELSERIHAVPGFNIIATANNRDRGVNDMSSALMRRFNTVVLPLPETMAEEVRIVEQRVAELGQALALPAEKPALQEIQRVVTIFRELREGKTADHRLKVKSPSGTLSTAEAIAVFTNGMALAAYYGDGRLTAADLASSLTAAIVQDPVQDRIIWQEYLQTVVRDRDTWKDLYRECQDIL